MLAELSLDEMADWLAYFDCEINPDTWQADLRNEVFRLRLLGAFAAVDDEELPTWNFPYFEEEPTLEEVKAAQVKTRKLLAEKEARKNGTPNFNGQHQDRS
jgi:hypothetical protein